MGVCNPNIPYANFWVITNNPTEHTMPNTPRNRVYCNCRFLGFITIHIAHTFKKGHRLMIQIQSSWFPLADRNPQKFVNIYEANDSDFQKATIRVFHDAINASNIILPVLK